MRGFSRLTLALPAAAALGGCVLTEAPRQIAADQATAQALANDMVYSAGSRAVTVHERPKIAGDKVALRSQDELPALFQTPVVLAASGQTLDSILGALSETSGMPMRITEFASDGGGSAAASTGTSAQLAARLNKPLSVNWEGPLRGILDQLARDSGLYWRYDPGLRRVEFYLYETRHFAVSLPMGTRTVTGSISGAALTPCVVHICRTGVASTRAVSLRFRSARRCGGRRRKDAVRRGRGVGPRSLPPPVCGSGGNASRGQVGLAVSVLRIVRPGADVAGRPIAAAPVAVRMRTARLPAVPGTPIGAPLEHAHQPIGGPQELFRRDLAVAVRIEELEGSDHDRPGDVPEQSVILLERQAPVAVAIMSGEDVGAEGLDLLGRQAPVAILVGKLDDALHHHEAHHAAHRPAHLPGRHGAPMMAIAGQPDRSGCHHAGLRRAVGPADPMTAGHRRRGEADRDGDGCRSDRQGRRRLHLKTPDVSCVRLDGHLTGDRSQEFVSERPICIGLCRIARRAVSAPARPPGWIPIAVKSTVG